MKVNHYVHNISKEHWCISFLVKYLILPRSQQTDSESCPIRHQQADHIEFRYPPMAIELSQQLSRITDNPTLPKCFGRSLFVIISYLESMPEEVKYPM